MSENPNSDNPPDDDPTDELPVLSEAEMAVMDAEVPILADAVTSETGEHTARLLVPRRPGPRLSLPEPAPPVDGAEAPSVAALERDIAALAARWGGLEAHLDRNATAITTLSEQLAATQQALNTSNTAQQRLVDQLQDREAGLESLRRSLDDSNVARHDLLADLGRKDERIEQLQAALERSAEDERKAKEALALKHREDDDALNSFAQELAESEARLAKTEQARAAAEAAHAKLEAELAQRDEALAEALASARERETQAATLASEVEQRDAAVGQLRAELGEHLQRIGALEPAAARAEELERELERQAGVAAGHTDEQPDLDEYRAEIASLTAYIENRRREWDDLHAALADHKTVISELERELAQRAERQMQLEATVRDETEHATAMRAELATLKEQLAGEAAALARQRFADPEAPSESQDERVRELEARAVTLERALAEQRDVLDARERELATVRAELEEQLATREQSEVIGSGLVDPELPVEVQSQRLATLQRELSERIEALRALQDEMTSGEVVDFDAHRGEDRVGTPADHRFSLVCLTSDEPEAYDIDKPSMIIGRGSDSDIQILTHFVSREHARLEREGEAVLIEDLGSTNGVFVNAVRVDRQPLQHGDWVTIGETQFRFLDRHAT